MFSLTWKASPIERTSVLHSDWGTDGMIAEAYWTLRFCTTQSERQPSIDDSKMRAGAPRWGCTSMSDRIESIFTGFKAAPNADTLLLNDDRDWSLLSMVEASLVNI